MVNENRSNVFAAIAGIVIGAGAAIVGAVALSDKNNQKKVKDVLAKGKSLVKSYVHDVNEKAKDTVEVVEKTVKVGKKKAKKLVKVVKTAEKGVKNI